MLRTCAQDMTWIATASAVCRASHEYRDDNSRFLRHRLTLRDLRLKTHVYLVGLQYSHRLVGLNEVATRHQSHAKEWRSIRQSVFWWPFS